MSTTNTRTATVTVHDDATPSAHYPADEQERNGAVDISVTIEIPAGDVEVDADEDEDDCLAAAATAYAAAHGLSGWDLAPRWTDETTRDTVTLSVPARTIEGEITLYRDDANGGLGSCGTPMDGWCSSEIITLANTLTDRSRRDLLASLGDGVGTETIEIEVQS